MKPCRRYLLLLPFFCFFTIASGSLPQVADRQPAVAGQFYPSDKSELRSELEQLFARAAPGKNLQNVLAVISPHAGYVFSGEVAASSMNQINPSKDYENIFVIGASHHVAYEGASIYTAGNFLTPLGTVQVNRELGEKLVKQYPVFNNRTDVHRDEHSLEVQLPFLQFRMKKNFRIVPVLLGSTGPEACKKIAEALRPYFTVKNLFVFSTDFSHYPPYEDAPGVDKATADAICTKSPDNLLKVMDENSRKNVPNLATSLCGWPGVLVLLYLVEGNPDISMNVIRYKNSGDSQVGDRSRVVGYYAIAVAQEQKKGESKFQLNRKEKSELLGIARKTITEYVRTRKVPDLDTARLPETLKTPCGAFVTLHKKGELRGCIGRFDATEPLYQVVQQMAVASSTEDYRFNPVEPEEVSALEIEISVLTPMRKIQSINEIELGKHGIYIKKGMRSGTFLPQVATETGWSREEFLGHCSQDKAGIGWDGWKDADVYVYEAKVFSERDGVNR